MRHTQSAFQILVLSANARIGHLLRTNTATQAHSPLASFIRQFDDSILECFKSIIACPVLSTTQISQIRLPERLSGIGLISAVHIAPAAFLGSARQAISELSNRGLTETVFQRVFHQQQLDESSPWCSDIRQNWGKYTQHLSIHNPSLETEVWSSNMFFALQPQQLQKNLFGNSMKAPQHWLLQNSSPLDRIRLHSCAATGSGAFLRAPANLQGSCFTNTEFQLAIKTRIGAPLNLLCPSACICGERLDDYGNHLFKCRIGNEWNHRHSTMVHLIASIIRSVQLTVQHEVALSNLGPLRSLDRDGNGRMDLVVTYSDSQTLLADVTITHPNPSTSTSLTEPMQIPLYFAKLQENRKIRRYGETIRLMRHEFAPLAFETYGATGPIFTKYLKRLASRHFQFISLNYETDISARSTLVRYWRTRISCCLQKANARLLISKANRVRANMRQGTPPHAPDLSECWVIS